MLLPVSAPTGCPCPGRPGCPLYVGFPKGRWDFSDVERLVIVRGEDCAALVPKADSLTWTQEVHP